MGDLRRDGGGIMRGLSEQEVSLGPGTSCIINGTVTGSNPGTILKIHSQSCLGPRHMCFLLSKEARQRAWVCDPRVCTLSLKLENELLYSARLLYWKMGRKGLIWTFVIQSKKSQVGAWLCPSPHQDFQRTPASRCHTPGQHFSHQN